MLANTSTAIAKNFNIPTFILMHPRRWRLSERAPSQKSQRKAPLFEKIASLVVDLATNNESVRNDCPG
ncbi:MULTISPECIES: hypothetical protein [unclassified Paludibacterium]|uniref:hypothetical protein n=1 Tax=unclassified Paludibacterium TaxID=2618429 RepID=UPI001C056EC7|nr:hypothetical protein [Paludibacterium sp. B53371]